MQGFTTPKRCLLGFGVAVRQPMYNLTVAGAHTFFVGEQQWLVHNIDCDVYGKLKRTISPGEQAHHLNQNAAYKICNPS